MVSREERALRGIKEVLDREFNQNYDTCGALNIRKSTFRDDSGAWRGRVVVESAGWDENYGGKVTIEASPTGRSLRVWTSKDPAIRVKIEKGSHG